MQILLDKHEKAFVADIGLGKIIGGHNTKASAATWYWAAPEQIEVCLSVRQSNS